MNNDCNVFIFEDSYKLTNFLYQQWIEIAKGCIKEKNRFMVGLSGGRIIS